MVNLERSTERVLGGRIGTAISPLNVLKEALGKPSYTDSVDGKVTIGWVFATPRGPAEIRDYWWNGPTEWSLASREPKAAMWLAKYLRGLGIKASTKNG